MIKDTITSHEIDELHKIVPDDEQGVVFTCSPVSQVVKRQTLNNRTIQIIDEGGIRAWCAITSTMPCRLNSVARVRYGDDRGKAVMVESVNYESGMAVVKAVPDRKEMTLPIGCLEEIGPDVDILIDTESENLVRAQRKMTRLENDFSTDPVDKILNQVVNNESVHVDDDFITASEEYFGFLCNLASLAGNTFETGLSLNVHAIHRTRMGLMKSIKPETFDGPHPDIDISEESRHVRYVEFKNGIHSTINMFSLASGSSFACECFHRLNETYRFTLCSHMVAAIIRLGFEEHRNWKFARHRISTFQEGLNALRMKNVMRGILALRDVIGDNSKQLIKEYIWSYMANNDEDQEATNTTGFCNAEKNIRDLLENNSELLKLLEILGADISKLDENSLKRVVNALYDH